MRKAPKIIIVSTGEKSGRIIANLLDPSMASQAQFERSGAGIRRRIRSEEFDLIIVNSPLSDEFGHELCAELCQTTTSGVILLTGSDVYDEVCDRVGEDGVLVVAKPISSQVFHQAVQMGCAAASRMQRMDKELIRWKKKSEEIKMVGRAKCMLMEFEGLSEAEAHREIEKKAMDTRRTRMAVADEIVRRYDI